MAEVKRARMTEQRRAENERSADDNENVRIYSDGRDGDGTQLTKTRLSAESNHTTSVRRFR